MPSRLRLALLVVALAAAGCAAEPLTTPGHQIQLHGADFTHAGGCADAIIWATNADDTIAVMVDWQGAASAAQSENGFSDTVSLPGDQVTVRLQLGRFLSEGVCTDVIMEGRPTVLAESPAAAGTAQIEVTPEGQGDPIFPLARVHLALTNVLFEFQTSEGAEQWTIDSLQLDDVQVGWLPG